MDKLSDQIEALIDAHGLYAVTLALVEVCGDKAEHLATSWQDYDAEKRWHKAAKAFDKTHTALHAIQLPGQ